MTESDHSDDTWEDFFGTSPPDLMPSIMGAFDAYLGHSLNEKDSPLHSKTSTPKRSHQANNFANLSPGVQKILSHIPDQEINKNFSSEEALGIKKFGHRHQNYRSLRSLEKTGNYHHLNKSSETLEIISSNVQKMLSNLPGDELVKRASTLNMGRTVERNNSFLFREREQYYSTEKVARADENNCDNADREGSARDRQCGGVDSKETSMVCEDTTCDVGDCGDSETSDGSNRKPLGSYLHNATHGIASRTPVGRKNMGKYLQVPSESSVGTMSSTTSSEVSRPVSLTSLGSCSSSGSSGPNQNGSAYLASVESLDSDHEHAGSQGSADSGIAEPLPMSPEQRVLQEVLDSEAVYVADLKEVIQGYLEPWRADPECPLAPHLQHLFSNIEEIYEFNRLFLEELRQADFDPTKIAHVFLQNDCGFSVYNEYCTNYPRTMDVLGELTRDEKMAPLFRENQTKLGHALPLGSYLLKPVQRILKYHLLLHRLSKQCEPNHQESVEKALRTMTGIASDINTMKRKHEDAVRVQEIQSQLYGWTGEDLTALGELIAEGNFRVAGARGRRHVFLFEKLLLLAKNKQDGALSYKSHIMCSNLMLVEQVRGEPLSFQVLPFDNPRNQCILRARSPQHKREWTLQIKRVMLENYSAVIPNHARKLVMQLGEDLNENDTTEKWSMKLTAPHYLERRSRVRKSNDFANRRAMSQDRSFVNLTSWRRKSEPNMIPQYDCKTMPKKISKLKKAKENTSCSKFYTDLSDSENCADESMESLAQTSNAPSTCDIREEIEEETDTSTKNTLEKIVSDLLMQNQDFKKVLNRQRRTLNSEPGPIWYEERPKLPSKADSLPRSFQLNDQIDSNEEISVNNNHQLESPLKEDPDVDHVEPQENDLSSTLNASEHPEHKIYRKHPMRDSILQRIRRLISEDQKSHKYPLHKQGSKSMGEKIAHPDYVDPQKLFVNSQSSSQINLSVENDCDIMGEREQLDMSINEKEVLNEFEKRLQGSTNSDNKNATNPGQNLNKSSHVTDQNSTLGTNGSFNSSQNSDSYYESLLDHSLIEEFYQDENGRLVARQDSFNNNERKSQYIKNHHLKHKENEKLKVTVEKKSSIKRPSKAPPPIPRKPTSLTNGFNNNGTSKSDNNNSSEVAFSSKSETITNSNNFSCRRVVVQSDNNSTQITSECVTNSKSWVKTMVGRFE